MRSRRAVRRELQDRELLVGRVKNPPAVLGGRFALKQELFPQLLLSKALHGKGTPRGARAVEDTTPTSHGIMDAGDEGS